MKQEESKEPSMLEQKYGGLTHELLKNLVFNEMIYLVIRLLQTSQIIYFVMRTVNPYTWDFSFVGYLSVFLNYISVDSLIQKDSSLFQNVLYPLSGVAVATVVLAVLVGHNALWRENHPAFVKFLIPIVNGSMMMFKTLLQIPCLAIIFIGFVPSFQQQLHLTLTSSDYALLALLLLTFLALQLYILTSYHEINPFSEVHHSGESIIKAFVMLFFKVCLVLYSLLDPTGAWSPNFCILFTVAHLLLIIYSHVEIGFYKDFSRRICLFSLYISLIFGFSNTVNAFTNDKKTSFAYLIIMSVVSLLLCSFVERKKRIACIARNVILIEKEADFIEHVLQILKIIDRMEQREYRIQLEGYLNFHARNCYSGELACPCQSLVDLELREEATEKTQFFKFMVTVLLQAKRKFPKSKQINFILAFIYHFRIKNPLQGIYSITKNLQKASFLDRLYFEHYMHLIENQMKEIDSKETLARTFNINKFFEYSNNTVEFEQKVQQCTNNHIEFWKLLLENSTEIKRLEEMGSSLTNSKENVKDYFESMLALNPNNIHTFVIYGKFLIEVTNEEISNVRYLQKADSIMKNLKESSKIDEAVNKYNQNAETAVVVISGNEGELGIVVNANNFTKQLIGYKRSELIGHNTSTIMPKIFGEQHNQVLSNYLGSSTSKVNGKERIVYALRKDGYMVPVTALTKVLPALLSGIHIVGFISVMEEKAQDEDQVNRNYSYILYRSDTEQVVGISPTCFTHYNIPCCLVYGDANNSLNELKIQHIFGVSIEKGEDGRIAAALEAGQAMLRLNTKFLSEQFIITKDGSSKEMKNEKEALEEEGVEATVFVRVVMSVVYFKVEMKLISFYEKNLKKNKELKSVCEREQTGFGEKNLQESKFENDDIKDLKDFKNFISIKSEPSAISTVSALCLMLICIVTSSMLGLVFNWRTASTSTSQMMTGVKKNLFNTILSAEMMFGMESVFVFEQAKNFNINSSWLIDPTMERGLLNSMIALSKQNKADLLPIKYYFDPNYSQLVASYSVNAQGVISSKQLLIDEVFTAYISSLQSILSSNLTPLGSKTINLTSNVYQQYLTVKWQEIYSLGAGLNATSAKLTSFYHANKSNQLSILYALCGLMILSGLLWLIISVPHVLSVAKINNRVLSLFCLIPQDEVCKLIWCCLNYLKNNLTEAVIREDEVEHLNESKFQPKETNLLSVEKHNETQSIMRKNVDLNFSAMNFSVEEKFEKMINSEDRSRKITILKFILIGVVIFGFILFYFLFSFQTASYISNELERYQIIGQRCVLVENIKLSLTQFLLDPNMQPLSSLQPIKQLNAELINSAYTLESQLLQVSFGVEQTQWNLYNTGNVCNWVNQFQDYAMIPTLNFTVSECLGVYQGIMAKGLKTAIVTLVEDVRAILSNYTSASSKQLLATKMRDLDQLIKYIQTPTLHVLSLIEKDVASTLTSSNWVIIFSGGSFVLIGIIIWQTLWKLYLEDLNNKIWRTKGMLNLIPMKIITMNQLLKNQFASGQLEKAVK